MHSCLESNLESTGDAGSVIELVGDMRQSDGTYELSKGESCVCVQEMHP